jgi:putative intracellular protease/amidase
MSALELQQIAATCARYQHRLGHVDTDTLVRLLQAQIPAQGKRCVESVGDALTTAFDRLVDAGASVRNPPEYVRAVFRAIVTGEDAKKRAARTAAPERDREADAFAAAVPSQIREAQGEVLAGMTPDEIAARHRRVDAIERWRNRIATGEKGLAYPAWAFAGWPDHHGPAQKPATGPLRSPFPSREDEARAAASRKAIEAQGYAMPGERGKATMEDAMSEAMSPLVEARDDDADWTAAIADGAAALAAAGPGLDEEDIF